MPLVSSDVRLMRLAQVYEALSAEHLSELLALYTPQASFKDPFNEVRGHAAIAQVFAHMFQQLRAPQFTVLQGAANGMHGFLLWEMAFARSNGQPLVIRGASHLEFSADGRVQAHRDYWDAAEELYAQLPVLGAATRWLQRRLRAPQPGA